MVVQVNQVRARMLRQYSLVVGLVCRVGFVLVLALVQVPAPEVTEAVVVLGGLAVVMLVVVAQVRLVHHLRDHPALVPGLP